MNGLSKIKEECFVILLPPPFRSWLMFRLTFRCCFDILLIADIKLSVVYYPVLGLLSYLLFTLYLYFFFTFNKAWMIY